ncbi:MULTISPECIES: helix-turn-helix domain-containing protein [Corynebacterium]|uniref:helix-turn-helix domain-containing protein n=1 Tax=Corynebacterium TaxID=1716 RepID=UPI0008A549C5|nr:MULTISPECIES: helix-turn-helix domain-containing protein [Corynebacterium]MDK8242502.1 helix-turn-helix domain-containing protein [Corynebacterium coyleae]MDK8898791.1 helix-turn-helix domain-containing protein [Corynebacterium sp. MSK004]OFL90714.1 hypothetical protein HMPREF2734_02895 [Corynebacterium sp. HMSC055D05]PLA39031.1 DNA-binding protein [Corynebacterium coyleae]
MTNKKIEQESTANQWVTVAQLSAQFNVSDSTIRRWLRRYGNVRYFRESNTLRINSADFDALVNSLVEKTMSEASEKR